MANVQILLADDHEMLRSGLRVLIDGEPDLAVVGEAADGRSAVRLAADRRPDVVVMDVMMPKLNGIDATRQIVGNNAQVRVICLSGRSDEQVLADALAAGAVGFVRKEAAFEELATAVRTVLSAGRYVSPSMVPALARTGVDDAARQDLAKLSSREREVLQLIAEGKATKEIAAALYVSVKTVETHRANLMGKLNLFSVAELTKYAVRHGIASLD